MGKCVVYRTRQGLLPFSAIVVALLVSGCSSDVSRFAYDSAGPSAPPPIVAQTAPQVNRAPEPRYISAGRVAAVRAEPLDPVIDGGGVSQSTSSPAATYDVAAQNPYEAPVGDNNNIFGADTQMVVAPGDTLFSIARRNDVPLNQLAAINGIEDPARLRVGQRLTIPVASNADHLSAPSVDDPIYTASTKQANSTRTQVALATPKPQVQKTGPGVHPNPSEAVHKSNIHTVAPGDTSYSIATRNGLYVSQLARLNGLSDPTALRVGQTLLLRGHEQIINSANKPDSQVAAAKGPAPTPTVATGQKKPVSPTASDTATVQGQKPAPVRVVYGQQKPLSQPDTSTKPVQVATRMDTTRSVLQSGLPSADPSTKNGSAAPAPALFRWPVQGRVISAFGAGADTRKNDGINIAVPTGTSVKAAKEGTVVYAGSELRTFGKLILVRHADGWVSAYAHNDELLVRRGDTVTRGQTIAKAGSTGEVSTPQVHFELRRDMKPVDPLKYLSPV